jgi:hypothetical protein
LYSSQAIQGCACLPCLWTPCPKSTLTGEPWVSPSSTPTVKWSFRSGVAVGGHLENNIAPSMPTRLHQRADYWRGADRVTDAISHSWLFTMSLHSRSNSKSDGVVAVEALHFAAVLPELQPSASFHPRLHRLDTCADAGAIKQLSKVLKRSLGRDVLWAGLRHYQPWQDPFSGESYDILGTVLTPVYRLLKA